MKLSDINYEDLRSVIKERDRKGSFPFPTYAEALFSQVLISRRPVENALGPSLKIEKNSAVYTSQGPEVAENQKSKQRMEVFSELKQELTPESDVKSTRKEIEKDFNPVLVLKESELKGGSLPYFADELSSNIKVLFVGETPKDFNTDDPNSDLLSRMIQAMKLKEGEYSRVFTEKDSDVITNQWHEILKKLGCVDHLAVVTLGASVTSVVLQKKERLSRIHGKEFKCLLERKKSDLKLSIFPIFHPDILQINPNMKRSAWMDLQKVMEIL